jgi:hypothetical protein
VTFHRSLSNAMLATVKSWNYPYQGNVAEVLYEYIKCHRDPNAYAHLLAVVQSSGMGKSRMIDEFSKRHFVIPLNLREGFQGRLLFPAGPTPSR